MKVLILYYSSTGNTKKVVNAINNGLEDAGLDVTIYSIAKAEEIDYFDYDLVCIGCPSIQWHPPKQVTEFLKKKFEEYRQQKKIKTGSPIVPRKNALIFCTYSGPHTGLDEAIPVGKYIGQFFAHIGFTIIDEMYILSEFHGSEERSTKGKMGDIRGKPTKKELEKIRLNIKNLALKLLTDF